MPRKHNRWRKVPRPSEGGQNEFWRIVAADDGVGIKEPEARMVDMPRPGPLGLGAIWEEVEVPYTQRERDTRMRLQVPRDLWVKYRGSDGKSRTVHTKLRDIEIRNPNSIHRSHYGCSSGFPEEHVYCVVLGGPMRSLIHYPITHWKVAKPS